jgi:hypothetical protein
VLVFSCEDETEVNSSPSVPELLSPLDGSVISDTIKFSWGESVDKEGNKI